VHRLKCHGFVLLAENGFVSLTGNGFVSGLIEGFVAAAIRNRQPAIAFSAVPP
jgi:hypothetical protein